MKNKILFKGKNVSCLTILKRYKNFEDILIYRCEAYVFWDQVVRQQ